jgi:hypothetical protein
VVSKDGRDEVGAPDVAQGRTKVAYPADRGTTSTCHNEKDQEGRDATAGGT